MTPVKSSENPQNPGHTRQERWELLHEINVLTDKPLLVLSFIWMGLVAIDLTTGLSRGLEVANYAIWALFVLDFVIEFMIAPHKGEYLRSNWLTAISLVLPALRILRLLRAFRVLQLVRAGRSVSLLRLVGSLNRGMGALGQTLGRRGAGYVSSLTALVTFVGAAGMAQFESVQALQEAGYTGQTGLGNYGEALWWTAMIMTTMGSEYWPRTVEGRVLGWLLSLYAFAVFGYLTATIASYFVKVDIEQPPSEPMDARTDQIALLHAEIAVLHTQMTSLVAALGVHPDAGSRAKKTQS
ncbi:MAG: ion transporter [Gemmatimonadaceae bacterium]|nr:ion transporter [Gloeobacterales cyanobacterium ES-bin-141]